MARALITQAQGWTLSIAATRALAAVILQKVIALGYGPEGVLVLGQLLLVQGLCYGLLTDGINRAAMVEAGKTATPEGRAALLVHGAKAGGILMCVVTVGIWLVMPLVLPQMQDYSLPLALGLGLGGLYWWAGPILQFEQKPKKYLGATALVGISVVVAALLPISWLPIVSDPLAGRLLIVVFGQALASVCIGIPYFRHLQKQAKQAPALPTWRLLREIGAYGGLSLAILLAGKGGDVLVRSIAMQHLDMNALGMWQASVRLGDVLLAPFVPLFGSLFFAQAAKMNIDTLRPALQHQIRFALLGVGFIGITVFIGPWLLAFLNRADFALGITYYRWQALGDMLRLISFPISIALLALGRLRISAWLEALSLASYLLLAYYCTQTLGTLGLALAHTVRYLFFALATIWVAKDLLEPQGERTPTPV